METSGDDLEREIQENVEKLIMEGEEKVNSEQVNTGEVKITKRFGIEGAWQTFTQNRGGVRAEDY
jgi:hypothetical protein